MITKTVSVQMLHGVTYGAMALLISSWSPQIEHTETLAALVVNGLDILVKFVAAIIAIVGLLHVRNQAKKKRRRKKPLWQRLLLALKG